MQKCYMVLTEDGRIKTASQDSTMGPETVEVEIPDDFRLEEHLENLHEYVVVNGALVHEPEPEA